jgi:hypothetical protein
MVQYIDIEYDIFGNVKTAYKNTMGGYIKCNTGELKDIRSKFNKNKDFDGGEQEKKTINFNLITSQIEVTYKKNEERINIKKNHNFTKEQLNILSTQRYIDDTLLRFENVVNRRGNNNKNCRKLCNCLLIGSLICFCDICI